MNKSLLILAAGMGSRYGGLKQMEGFGPNGETLLEYGIFDALRHGFRRAVFVIRKDMERDFRERVTAKFEDRIEVELVFQDRELSAEEGSLAGAVPERTKPWGTGHALLTGLSRLSEPFLVLNADDYYGSNAFMKGVAFLDGAAAEAPHFALLAYRLDRTLSPHGQVSRGIVERDDRSRLTGIREQHEIERKTEGIQYLDAKTGVKYILGGETPVSMNLLAMTPAVETFARSAWEEFLAARGSEANAEFGIPDILSAIVRNGETVTVVLTDEKWMGVTHVEDAAFVRDGLRKKIKAGIYPERLWK